MKNPDKYDVKENKIFYSSLFMIFLLISFRAPGVNKTALTYSVPSFIRSIQSISLNLVVAILIISTTYFIIKNRTFQPKIFSSSIINFLLFQQIIAITDWWYSADLSSFITTLVFNFFVFIYMGYIVKSITPNYKSLNNLLHYSFYGILVFISLNAFMQVVGIGTLMWKGRFFGLTSQPNFIGMCAGLCATFATAFIADTKNWRYKLFYFIAIIIGVAVCIWSGSRSSIISFIAGSCLVFYLSIKEYTLRNLIIIIGIILVFVIYINFDAISIDYTDRGNTRENTWKQLMSIVLELPILGHGSKATATTNSYLYAIATTGLLGSFYFYKSLYKLILGVVRKNRLLQNQKSNYYVFNSITCFLLVGAIFEGFLLDSASIPVFVYWLMASYGK